MLTLNKLVGRRIMTKRIKTKAKRLIAGILAVLLVVGSVPTTGLAADIV